MDEQRLREIIREELAATRNVTSSSTDMSLFIQALSGQAEGGTLRLGPETVVRLM